jgi:hypothetical protein
MSDEKKSAKIPNVSRKNEEHYEQNIEKAIAELEQNASRVWLYVCVSVCVVLFTLINHSFASIHICTFSFTPS